MNLRIILAIARKDLIDALRNYYILFGIAFPIGIWVLFGLVFPSQSTLELGSVAVYDAGQSRIVENLKSTAGVTKLISTRSLEETKEVVQKEAIGGLVVPAGFDEAVAQGQTPELMVFYNGKRGGGELAAFRQLVQDQVRLVAKQPQPAKVMMNDVNEAANASANANFNLQEFLLVMVVVMGFAMTGSFVVPTLLVEEKEKKTLKAMLVSPASYADVVVGKAIVGFVYAVLVGGILLVLNDPLKGSPFLTLLGVVLGGLAMVEIGLLIGAIAKNSNQVNTWSSIIMMALIIPTWITVISVSEPLQAIMRALPTYYITELIVAGRGGNADISAIASVMILVGFVVVLFGAIVWALRREQA